MIRKQIKGCFRWLMTPIDEWRARRWLKKNAPMMRRAAFDMVREQIADTKANGTAEDQLVMYAMLGQAAGAGQTAKPDGK